MGRPGARSLAAAHSDDLLATALEACPLAQRPACRAETVKMATKYGFPELLCCLRATERPHEEALRPPQPPAPPASHSHQGGNPLTPLPPLSCPGLPGNTPQGKGLRGDGNSNRNTLCPWPHPTGQHRPPPHRLQRPVHCWGSISATSSTWLGFTSITWSPWDQPGSHSLPGLGPSSVLTLGKLLRPKASPVGTCQARTGQVDMSRCLSCRACELHGGPDAWVSPSQPRMPCTQSVPPGQQRGFMAFRERAQMWPALRPLPCLLDWAS